MPDCFQAGTTCRDSRHALVLPSYFSRFRDMDKDSKARILVADDNEQLRQTLVVELAEGGYDVVEAASGNDAIPLLHGSEIDLVILDLKMPYIEGFEVLKFIKSSFPKIKTI